MKKRLLSFLCTAAAAVTSALMLAAALPEMSADAAADGFYVSGTSIMDANGNAFVMRGVNIPHAWYTSYTEASIKGAAANGANTVRVVAADGGQWTKTTRSQLKNIVSLCKENNLVCILEAHDATGSDSTSDLDAAVDYWIANKNVLKGNEKYVILNIANEWYGSWNGSSWAAGYKTAIADIRNAGIDNMLMIDCAGWGQYPDSIKYYGRSVFDSDPDKNTVFSIHMYEYAGANAAIVKKNIDNALNIGVPVVIGEFGARHTNGDVDEATIMSYCTEKNVGYLGWSWKGNSSDLSYLDIAEDWDGKTLTDWGDTLINGDHGIKATSKVCSVYTGGTISFSGTAPESATALIDGVTIDAVDGTFTLPVLDDGYYEIMISAPNYVPRTYIIGFSGGRITEEIQPEICLIGDINGDGLVSTSDITAVKKHLKKTAILSDYMLACAAAPGGDSDKVSTEDITAIKAHLKGTKRLW